jgi:Rod binding domain-containing protein
MNVSAIPSSSQPASAANISPESLAGNKALTQEQKIAEASRQFEAMLLRQILSESQKPMINSEFTDNSTASGIYQDFIVNQMSDSLSKSGKLGFAKIFEDQLTPHQPPSAMAAVTEPVTASTAHATLKAKVHHAHQISSHHE